MLYKSFNENSLPIIKSDNKTKGATELLEWAFRTYGENLLYACSFGVEGSVMIHLISQIKQNAKVLFLDTEVHFKETYETIERTTKRYPELQISMKKPALTISQQGYQHGDELWNRNPDHCCLIRKILPLEEELGNADAWISGLRREQSSTRANVNFINRDDRFHLIKICPLIYWTWQDIWAYVREYDLPYNLLHDQNYPSIGCIHCTKPSSGNNREGRWQGKSKLECGIHNSPLNKEAN